MNWLGGAKKNHGLDIDYIGLWNKRAYDRTYTLALRDAIKSAGLKTAIVAADSCPPESSWMWSICDRVVDDQEWAGAFDIVGSHYVNSNTTDNCRKLGKPIWESEGLWADYHDGSCWARVTNRNYVYANITSTIAWNANAAYLRGLPDEGTGLMSSPSPWSGFYGVDKVVWATAHTTHFTQPGWTYLAHNAGVGLLDGGGTYVSLTDGVEVTMIVESMVGDHTNCIHESPPSTPVNKQTVVFELTGELGSKVQQLHVFYSSFAVNSTDDDAWFVYRGQVTVTDNRFNLTLLPNELYTFSTLNSTKGSFPDSPIPSETPFPSQYDDDFNSYGVHHQPRYLTDQSGSYEIVESSDSGHGRVLRQMVPAKPIAWCDESPLTYTVVGSHEWRAMNASVQAYIEHNNDRDDVIAFLATSVTDGGCMGGAGSNGIVLAVVANGTFLVSNSTGLQAILDQGSVSVKAGEWHELRIVVDDAGGSFYVDGVLKSHVHSLSTTFASGWVGFGSSFDYVQFDNLHIQAGSTESHIARGAAGCGGQSVHSSGQCEQVATAD